jgi:hypothetical protein
MLQERRQWKNSHRGSRCVLVSDIRYPDKVINDAFALYSKNKEIHINHVVLSTNKINSKPYKPTGYLRNRVQWIYCDFYIPWMNFDIAQQLKESGLNLMGANVVKNEPYP